METTKTFEGEVLIPVGCDLHPWRRSYITCSAPVLRGHQGGRFVRDQEPPPAITSRGEPSEAENHHCQVTVKDGDAKLDLPFKS